MKVLLRPIACLALTAALGGCNLVLSEKPMFTAADAAGAPVLRDGVWAAPDKGCDFDQTKPIDQWPKCAGGDVVGGSVMRPIQRKDDDEGFSGGLSTDPSTFILAAGDPRVMQATITIEGRKGEKQTVYAYLGLEPLAYDAQGRIVKLDGWLVQCGPPPEEDDEPPAKDKPLKLEDAMVARHPLPGLTVADGNCTPRDKAAVRNAAKASKAWKDPDQMPTYWVRDGTN